MMGCAKTYVRLSETGRNLTNLVRLVKLSPDLSLGQAQNGKNAETVEC